MDNSTTFEVVSLVGNTALDSPDKFLEPFYYRILTASRQVKYLGVKGTEPNSLDIHGKELGFDTVPNGTWTIGILTIRPATGKLVLTSTIKHRFAPSIPGTPIPLTCSTSEIPSLRWRTRSCSARESCTRQFEVLISVRPGQWSMSHGVRLRFI